VKHSCTRLVSEYPPFSFINPKTGEWTGFDIELFKMVARQGEFEFNITQLRLPSENETYNKILYNEGREYDMLVSWYVFLSYLVLVCMHLFTSTSSNQR